MTLITRSGANTADTDVQVSHRFPAPWSVHDAVWFIAELRYALLTGIRDAVYAEYLDDIQNAWRR